MRSGLFFRKKLLKTGIFAMLLLVSEPLWADHLFGAYLSVMPINANTGFYRVRLQLYFDMTEINKDLTRELGATNPKGGFTYNFIRKKDNRD
jgi:hypothetical protein